GTWIYYGGWYPNYQMKLFRKSKGVFTGILVHEKVEIQGQVKKLNFPILHYSYKNISDHLKFIDKYSTLFALEKYKQGKRSGVFWAFGKSIYKFIYMYFVKLGFLHGRIGFIIAILGAYYNFLKYVKLFELGLKNEKK
ncbi:MAG: glycosyltransferase family 2 protein, partial [Leptospiraceae bacterium]|nr:glycosyltransferase family 2 protein [Leptospiraceae bacterium]